jgi:hypothetical protein
MPCTMPKFSTPTPRTSSLRAPLTKLSCDNIYSHCMCTNKIPLCYVNTAHTTCTISMSVHTACASITHAPLNLHHTMLILVHTHVRQNFQHITTLHRATQKLSVHPRMPIFFACYHSALCRAKFNCTHPCTKCFPCGAKF